MKLHFLRLLIILALSSLACTVSFDLPASRTGDVQTVTINEAEPVPGGAAEVVISMGGGTLNISGGASQLVSGTIEYNLEEWEPQIERSDSRVQISQDINTIPIPQTGQEMVNLWNLQLGDTPIALEINAGAYNGNLNFSGVPLVSLNISGGASDAEVRFDTPNPEQMTTFEYRTGASSVRLIGLGNANFAEMLFTGAAGDYHLDFTGQAEQAATVDVSGAIGNMTLVVPQDRAVDVRLTGGLRNIDAQGNWQEDGDVYRVTGTGPALSITVDMAVGNLVLISE